VVVADSPLLSTLVAQNTEPDKKGTALTIVNCIGYAITIVSIQTIGAAQNYFGSSAVYMLLSLGPVFGLFNLLKLAKKN